MNLFLFIYHMCHLYSNRKVTLEGENINPKESKEHIFFIYRIDDIEQYSLGFY